MHTGLRHPVPAVAAIILRDDEILLVKRGADPAVGKWSIPGGSVEIGETLRDALKREVLEETDLEIEPGRLAGVSDLVVEREGCIQWHYVLINFFATIVSGKPAAGSDSSDIRWVKLSDIKDYQVTRSLLERLQELGLLPAEHVDK